MWLGRKGRGEARREPRKKASKREGFRGGSVKPRDLYLAPKGEKNWGWEGTQSTGKINTAERREILLLGSVSSGRLAVKAAKRA